MPLRGPVDPQSRLVVLVAQTFHTGLQRADIVTSLGSGPDAPVQLFDFARQSVFAVDQLGARWLVVEAKPATDELHHAPTVREPVTGHGPTAGWGRSPLRDDVEHVRTTATSTRLPYHRVCWQPTLVIEGPVSFDISLHRGGESVG